MNLLYQTQAIATGGRSGKVSTADGTLALALTTPKELGGGDGDGTNPEQLFAAGYAACFLSAIRFVASRRKLTLAGQSSVTAKVGIGMRDAGDGFELEIELQIYLPTIETRIAHQLIEEADIVCPYSHLTRNNIVARLSLID